MDAASLAYFGVKGAWVPTWLRSTILAMRPWSFAVSFVPVALTATLLLTEGREVQPQDVLLPVFGAVFAHAAGNLVNTWVDHKSGLDTPSRADDRSLVDGIVSPNTVAGLAIACLTVAGAVCGYYVEVRGVATFLPVAAAGIAIGVFYTAKPISLKYNGLGDIAVFTAFGPLVMAGASLAMVGRVPASVLTLSLGVGLLTTGILHANNTRDIAVDAAAGATSCAVVLHRCTARSARTTGARGNLNAAYFTFLVLGGWAATLLAVLVQVVAGVLLPVPASVLNAAPPHIRAAAALALGTGALSPDAFEGWVAPHAPKEFFNIPHPYWVHTGVWGDVDVPQAVLWPAVTAVSIFACMLPWAFALIARFRRGGDDLATLPQQTAQFALSTGTAAFAALVPAAVLGRFTLAILFCLGGVNNIIMWHHASRLVQSKLSYFLASARGALCCVATSRNGHAEAALLPLPLASTALALAVAGQYLASLAFMFGVYPREAAMVLVAFLAPVTFLVHDFWNVGLRSNAWEPQVERAILQAAAKAQNEAEGTGSGAEAGGKDGRARSAGRRGAPESSPPTTSTGAVENVESAFVPTFPDAFSAEFVHFFKNIGMLGGLLLYLALTA